MRNDTRLLSTWFALFLLAMSPGVASGLGVSIVSVYGDGADGILAPGETVTFELVAENDTAEEIYGIEVKVGGYDLPGLTLDYDLGLGLQSGSSSARLFDDVDATGSLTPGIESTSPPVETAPIGNLSPQTIETFLFQGVSTAPTNGRGQSDIGVGGNPVAGGATDVHFRVTYVNLLAPDSEVAHSVVLSFSMEAITNFGELLPTTGDTFALTMIPEPGIAIPIGIGLCLLARLRD